MCYLPLQRKTDSRRIFKIKLQFCNRISLYAPFAGWLHPSQWRNRWGRAGEAECPPPTSDREISAHQPGKKRRKEKWKKGNEKEKKEKCKRGRWEIENGRRKDRKWAEDLFLLLLFLLFTFLNDETFFFFCFSLFETTKPFFFFFWLFTFRNDETFFFFFFFCFSLFETTKICFGSTKMEIFYREKHLTPGKKNQEKWLCPLRKIFLLRPWPFPLSLKSKPHRGSYCYHNKAYM